MPWPTRPTPNLARRPFLNRRPVVRASVVLWILGSFLLAVNGLQYWRDLHGREESGERLQAVREEIRLQEQHGEEVAARLRSVDLELQNEQVRFLNLKLAERSFGWSRLFDELAELLPLDVRLERLAPESPVTRRSRSARRVDVGERVGIRISGQSRGGDPLLEFLDALFEAPAFESPDLSQETVVAGNLIRFDVRVTYLPLVTAAQEREQTADQGADEESDGSKADGGSAPAAGPVAAHSAGSREGAVGEAS